MQDADPITGRLMQKEIKVGHDEDEVDGTKGQSATQKATVYPLYLRDKIVRLIDTPGIGDVRGTDQDAENMTNILSVLRSYDKLRGILILLKPNNARLGVMFKFCIKELLTHLHRNAAENMVFGFTNTRGSNYAPGDTFGPLETILDEYKDVIQGLYNDTVYCFDFESFRYLAARKKGLDMGHIEDYRRSWNHVANEAQRLVQYFQGLRPHQVKATVSLNETRYLIQQLMQPIAKISAAIQDSITQNQQQIRDLANTKAPGKELVKKLHITKTVVAATQLTQPKTVCSNAECVMVVKDVDVVGALIFSTDTIKIRKVQCKREILFTLPKLQNAVASFFARLLTNVPI